MAAMCAKHGSWVESRCPLHETRWSCCEVRATERTCEKTADFTTVVAATVTTVQTSPPIVALAWVTSNKDCTCSNSTTSTSLPTES